MKNIILILTILGGAVLTANAQSWEEFRDLYSSALRNVNTSPEQMQKFKKLVEVYSSEDTDIRNDFSIVETKKEEIFKNLSAKYSDYLLTKILTPEQAAKVKTLTRISIEDNNQSKNNTQSTKSFRILSIETLQSVAATPEQIQKFKNMMKSFESKSKTLQENKNLTAQEKQEQAAVIRKGQMTAYWKILTKKQATEIKKMYRESRAN